MPDNWIGHIKLTNETELVIHDKKVHELIPCNQGDDVEINQYIHPTLWKKLGGVAGESVKVYLPNIPVPENSPHPYKIIADAT